MTNGAANGSRTPSLALTNGLLGLVTVLAIVVTYQVCFAPAQCVQCPVEVSEGDTVVVQPGDTVVITGGDSVMVTAGDSVIITGGDRALDDSVVVVGGDSAATLVVRHGRVSRRP
jgi:hypothetical protein